MDETKHNSFIFTMNKLIKILFKNYFANICVKLIKSKNKVNSFKYFDFWFLCAFF